LLKLDAHRQSLNNFDEIARRVLGRQQSQRRAGAHRKTGDPAREYAPAAIHVGIHVDRLTDTQILQLCLFEIGVDPNFAKRADAIRPWPARTLLPGLTLRRVTTPSISAMISQ
jgi:hypothetical protein